MARPKRIGWLYGKLKTAGPFDREDRLVLANELLRCQDPSYPTIESFNELEQDEVDYLIEALKHWEVIQEARLLTGNLALDDDVAELASQYQEASNYNQDQSSENNL